MKKVRSLRTSDSLTDNESYFFAELKRLKQIIDRLNKGEELFIILDGRRCEEGPHPLRW